MSGCSLKSRRGVVSFRIGSDGVRGDGEEGSRGLVLGCSNRRLPEGQAGGECVRRGVSARRAVTVINLINRHDMYVFHQNLGGHLNTWNFFPRL